jgi:hypothetical protein
MYGRKGEREEDDRTDVWYDRWDRFSLKNIKMGIFFYFLISIKVFESYSFLI